MTLVERSAGLKSRDKLVSPNIRHYLSELFQIIYTVSLHSHGKKPLLFSTELTVYLIHFSNLHFSLSIQRQVRLYCSKQFPVDLSCVEDTPLSNDLDVAGVCDLDVNR